MLLQICSGIQFVAKTHSRKPIMYTAVIYEFIFFSEIYHAEAWCNNPRFLLLMVKLLDGTSIFLRDCVSFFHLVLGIATGVVKKFYYEVR